MGKKLRLMASGVLLSLLAWWIDWRRIADEFSRLRWGWWLLAVGLYVLAQLVSSLRWQLLSRPLGFTRSLGRHVALYFVGMFFNLILPTSVGGDVVRAWHLAAAEEAQPGGGRRAAAVASVLLDRLSGLVLLLVIAAAAAFACPPEVPASLKWTAWSVAGGGLFAIVGVVCFCNRPIANCKMQNANWQLERQHTGEPRPRRLWNNLQFAFCNLHFAMSSLRGKPVVLVQALLLSAVVQAANVLLVWAVGRSLAAPVPFAYYWLLVPLVSLLALVPISINGMGVREGATLLLLAPLGVPASTAVSLAFLWFAACAAASLGGVVFYVADRGRRPKMRLPARAA